MVPPSPNLPMGGIEIIKDHQNIGGSPRLLHLYQAWLGPIWPLAPTRLGENLTCAEGEEHAYVKGKTCHKRIGMRMRMRMRLRIRTRLRIRMRTRMKIALMVNMDGGNNGEK